MKNRKFLYGLLIMILVVAIGIGYALTTQVLQINGQASAYAAQDSDFIVEFSKAENVQLCDKVAGAGLVGTLTTETLTFANDKDTAIAEFTIKNSSKNLKAKITNNGETKFTTADGYFEVTVTSLGDGVILDANGGETVVTVTVRLIKMPTQAISGKTFTVKFNADALEV